MKHKSKTALCALETGKQTNLLDSLQDLAEFYLAKARQAIDCDDSHFNYWFAKAAVIDGVIRHLEAYSGKRI